MRFIGWCAAVMLSTTLSAATLYKVTNADGSVTYTDRPVPGAEAVDLGKVNSATIPRLASSAPKPANKQREQISYDLNIVQPAEEATVRSNLGEVTVTGRMTPTAAGRYELYLDGALMESSGAPTFKLSGVHRGAHTLEIKFRNNSGKILASSPQRVFFLHRVSALITVN